MNVTLYACQQSKHRFLHNLDIKCLQASLAYQSLEVKTDGGHKYEILLF